MYLTCFCSGSLFTNSNWFAFEGERAASERSTSAIASQSPSTDLAGGTNGEGDDDVIVGGDDDLDDTAASSPLPSTNSEDTTASNLLGSSSDKPPVWVEWRETDSSEACNTIESPNLPNGEIQVESSDCGCDYNEIDKPCISSDDCDKTDGGLPQAKNEEPDSSVSESLIAGDGSSPSTEQTSNEDVKMEVGKEETLKLRDDKDNESNVAKEAES